MPRASFLLLPPASPSARGKARRQGRGGPPFLSQGARWGTGGSRATEGGGGGARQIHAARPDLAGWRLAAGKVTAAGGRAEMAPRRRDEDGGGDGDGGEAATR